MMGPPMHCSPLITPHLVILHVSIPPAASSPSSAAWCISSGAQCMSRSGTSHGGWPAACRPRGGLRGGAWLHGGAGCYQTEGQRVNALGGRLSARGSRTAGGEEPCSPPIALAIAAMDRLGMQPSGGQRSRARRGCWSGPGGERAQSLMGTEALQLHHHGRSRASSSDERAGGSEGVAVGAEWRSDGPGRMIDRVRADPSCIRAVAREWGRCEGGA
jgi:hypothetical protein